MVIRIGSKNIRCTTSGKGPHVWSLVTEGVAVSEIRESKDRSGIMKNNNKDSTEIKKQ